MYTCTHHMMVRISSWVKPHKLKSKEPEVISMTELSDCTHVNLHASLLVTIHVL